MKIKTILLALASLLAFSLQTGAQTVQVSGKVLEPDSQPAIGAAVFQQGNESNGTVTDMDGSFRISVPKGAKLVISSLGFATATVDAVDGVVVTLENDSNFLEDVVVVGYGVQKKSNLTGAISTVSSKDIEGRTITNLNQALQGKTAGVNLVTTSAQPGAVPTIRIRGIASNGTSDPLYVVDGLITEDISQIDPNTIESMEVLKDAASAAIYGAQAGNGVILISTKKGAKGRSSVAYDMQFSMSSLAHKPELLSSKDYFQQQLEYNPTFTEDEMLLLIQTGVWDGKSSTDWYSEVFNASPTWRHTVTAQGANDKGSFFLSLSNLDEDGIVKLKRDYYKRFAVSLNADYQVQPWLKVGVTADYANYECGPVTDAVSTHGEGFYLNVFGATIAMPPYVAATYAPGSVPDAIQSVIDKGELQVYTDENGNYYGEAHPLATMKAREMKNYGNSISGTLFANFTPLKGLVVTSRLGYRLSDAHSYVYAHKAFMSTYIQITDNSVKRTNNSDTYYQWENFANYSHSFGRHNLSAMVGMSYSQNQNVYNYLSVTKTIEDSDLFADISFASSDAGKTMYAYDTYRRKLSYFGRLSYDYDEKYLAEAIFRADAADTSVLPATNRWGYFPSFSAGWVISKEDFWRNLGSPVSFLKLRGSWGLNGSTSNLSGYSYSNSLYLESAGYAFSNTGLNYTQVQYPTQLYNPNLKWETSQQLDLGLDLRAFADRLSFSIDYYDKQTKDLIINNVNVPYEAGNAAAPMNAGNIKNTGVEIDLGWKDQIGDFFYSVSGNIATLDNKVTYLDPNVGDGRIYGTALNGNYVTAFEVGKPVWYFYGYHMSGLDENGAPVYQDQLTVDTDGDGVADAADGLIDANDKIMIGKPLPSLSYGLTLSLGWKGFDLTVFGNGTVGNDVMMAYSVTSISYHLKSMFDQRWTPTNTNARYPAPSINNYDKYISSDAILFDGSYFRIKQIQLGYTLPSRISKKFLVENLRVYASADNAFLFTKYPGIDPEVAANAITGMGIDFGSYPTTKKGSPAKFRV